MRNPFEYARQLYRYLTGGLSGEEGARWEREWEGMPGMRELVEELLDKERVGEELGKMGGFDTERAWRRLERRATGHAGNGRRLGRRLAGWSVAAAVVAAVAVGGPLLWKVRQAEAPIVAGEGGAGRVVVMLETADGRHYGLDTLSTLRLEGVEVDNGEGCLRWESDGETGGEEVAYNKVTVPYGGTYRLELPDGSRVHLNSGTELEFPSRFLGKERRVRVSGEIYCEVARNERQPFVVEAGGMDVQVLGTVFNVKAYADDGEVYTTLVSGSVRVGDGVQGETLVPGELATYSRETGILRVEPGDVEEQTAWKDGLFYFKQLPLERILKMVARWYNLEVFYANEEVREVVFNGKMPMYSSVEDILKKFEYADDVRFELKGRTLTVYKR